MGGVPGPAGRPGEISGLSDAFANFFRLVSKGPLASRGYNAHYRYYGADEADKQAEADKHHKSFTDHSLKLKELWRPSTNERRAPERWSTQPEPAPSSSPRGNTFHPATTSSTPTRDPQPTPSWPPATGRPWRPVSNKTTSRTRRSTSETDESAPMSTSGSLLTSNRNKRSPTKWTSHK